MRVTFRHSITYGLMALILFSTIGFNIIVSFCGGCESEHINVALIADTSDECSCCANSNKNFHCCSAEAKHTNEHHQKKNTLAQLKFDSTEAKNKVIKVVLPVVNFFSVIRITDAQAYILTTAARFVEVFSLPLSGRSILQISCILRI